jgi:hypothetical protein
MPLINARTTKLRRQIIGVRDFFEYHLIQTTVTMSQILTQKWFLLQNIKD